MRPKFHATVYRAFSFPSVMFSNSRHANFLKKWSYFTFDNFKFLFIYLFIYSFVFSYSLMKEKLLNVLDDAAHRIIITTGGVSMGEKVFIY